MMKRRAFLGGTFSAVTLGSYDAQSVPLVARNPTAQPRPKRLGPIERTNRNGCGYGRAEFLPSGYVVRARLKLCDSG